MVKELVGKYDGYNALTFHYNEERGKWESSILPSTPSGRYIIQLYATDYAGNSSYWGSVLFTWDSSTMEVSIKIIDITAAARESGFATSKVYLSDYHAIFRCSKCINKGKAT